MKLMRRTHLRSHTRKLVLLPSLTLVSTIAILAILSYFPFDWDPPHIVRNDVTRTSAGDLRFGDRNVARSSDSPEWLAPAQKSGLVTMHMEVRPQFPQRYTPTSIMMLARDYWDTSFAIGQRDTDLLFWVHRLGSNDNGDPPFVVTDVFRPNHWTDVQLQIVDVDLTVTIDGKVRLREHLPSGTLKSWPGGRIALGDEVNGGRAWRGDIRQAEIKTPGDSIDYVRSMALVVPTSYLYFPEHITPFPPPTLGEWFILWLHLLSFIPIGLLLIWFSRPAITVRSATITALGIAVVLALGKFLFAGRHTSVADLVMQFLGGLIGAMLGEWALRKATQRRSA